MCAFSLGIPTGDGGGLAPCSTLEKNHVIPTRVPVPVDPTAIMHQVDDRPRG